MFDFFHLRNYRYKYSSVGNDRAVFSPFCFKYGSVPNNSGARKGAGYSPSLTAPRQWSWPGIYTSFIHQKKLVAKFLKAHRKQTQVNLANMQLFQSFSAQPGLRVIEKFNINSITQLTCNFDISSILLKNVMQLPASIIREQRTQAIV